MGPRHCGVNGMWGVIRTPLNKTSTLLTTGGGSCAISFSADGEIVIDSAVKNILIYASLLLLSACGDVDTHVPADTAHPFVGCWQSADGLGFEEWTRAANGWLMGYAMNLDNAGEVTFFEQMRIERGESDTLFVSGGNDKAVPFKLEAGGDANVLRFVNPKHDHPQVITYRREGDALNAEISKLDGTGGVKFPKVRCAS